MVILVGLAIDQIAQSGLSSLSVIYYSAQLFSIKFTLTQKSSTEKEYLRLSWVRKLAYPDLKSVIKQSALCKKQPKIVIKNTVLKSDQY
ncbi:hypothetical protein AN664_0224755 [Serratia marcescens]|nr:hypothetical protein AN701_0225435 [Serratia marcescens]OCN34441.1 hypothetical protein AN658_0224825 [Serratia marcescens]OCN35268.1 hypothetical protein AN660_0225205 [Serratia marcescens]OCN55664.1 hypothetical protein AN664_0224755 [Serratia marcescens]OCO87280.1 hypothetical protein AN655_0225355 [Serratia marcescens]